GGSQDDLGRERDQFGRVFAHGRGLAVAQAIVDLHILPDRPARLLQGLRESRQAGVPFRLVRGIRCEHADAAHPVWLLRARRERPRGCRTAKKGDELAPPNHSITSSASASSLSGISRWRAFAVVRLITNSNLVGCTTGRLAGFSPLRMRPA